MKKFLFLINAFIVLAMTFSCQEKPVDASFEEQEDMTIYDYINENKDLYSDFLLILKKGGIDMTMSAYNPNGVGYTLFLPDNDAVDQFIAENDQFSNLDELLNNAEYVAQLCRYHVVNMSINSNDFPFGALPAYTLSGDFLTVGFVIETDTSYYKINNQAPVIKTNLEMSNGLIHVISNMLKPISYTTYEWLSLREGYTIFRNAVDETGQRETFDINIKDEVIQKRPFSLFVEHDSVFNRQGIFTIEDLNNRISPGRTDYTNTTNPLYNFVAYHALSEIYFMDDFVGINTNYTTYSEIPLNISGIGLDILINKGKVIFDTLIVQDDTTIIDYIGFNYDASNVLTQSGVIHFIDRVMMQQKPTRAIQTFEFYEEPLLNEYRMEAGDYLIEDSSSLNLIKWSGTDLFFIETGDETSSAWGGDYLFIEGDFSVSYEIPKLVQGAYSVFLGADAFYQMNALVEVSIDGKVMGGLIDLATGGSSGSPFARIKLGTIDFLKYEKHKIEVRSLIPGRLCWDYIRFEPL